MKKNATSVVKFHEFEKRTYEEIKELEFKNLAHLIIQEMNLTELMDIFNFEILDPRMKTDVNEHLHYLKEREIVEFKVKLK